MGAVRKRVQAIDAARGTAMLFVFLSHFADVYFRTPETSEALKWSFRISMVASPTFMLISGIMLGFLYSSHADDFGATRVRLIRRGLFLLTLGRALIMLAHVAISGSFQATLYWGFVTDTIGFCMIAGPMMIGRIGTRNRMLLALLLYCVSTALYGLWLPTGSFPGILKEIFVGKQYGEGVFLEFFPLLPWFSLYVVGSCVGETIGKSYMAGTLGSSTSRILSYALAGIGSAVLITGGYRVLLSGTISGAASWLPLLMSTGAKRPPMPTYFLFYGGIGLLILYVYFRFEETIGFVRSLSQLAAMIGRTSLFVFILQYYVYYMAVYEMHLPYSVFWPVYFAVSVLLMLPIVKIWDQRRWVLGNDQFVGSESTNPWYRGWLYHHTADGLKNN